MNRRLATLVMLMATATPGAAADIPPAGPLAPVAAAALDRGAGLLAPFKQRLQAALAAGLAEGPAQAVGVCREDAPAIAAELSVDGVAMGRTSHRLRNPANAPPAWTQPLLAGYLASVDARRPAAVAIADGRIGYVEPIAVQPLCLTCHGSELAPELSATLGRLYPDDRATGFAAGDFRGLFWVEFPAAD